MRNWLAARATNLMLGKHGCSQEGTNLFGEAWLSAVRPGCHAPTKNPPPEVICVFLVSEIATDPLFLAYTC